VILDSSVIVSVLLDETDRPSIEEKLGEAAVCRVGAPTLVETAMVLTSRMGLAGRSLLGRFLQEKQVEVVDFTDEHWNVAYDAFRRFGKGRHPAGLNFGDCMSYAVASVASEPLLCVGDDFPQTDLKLVE
jgi:ribonuclease VapC